MRDPETTRVSSATRKRVVEIAKRFNYRPNLLARSLVGQKSSTLGLVITTLLNPFYAEITQAIIDRAKEDGYGVIASSVGNGGPEVEQHYADELLDRGVDGLIICSALRNDPVVNELRKRGVPFVLALRRIDEGVLEAFAEKDIKVPDDIALVGFDDIEMAGLPGVELTTISHPKHTLGRLAVEQLLAKIKGQSDNVVKKSFIDPVLVIRKTCGYHAWKESRKKEVETC